MLGLPKSTELNKQLPKKAIYAKFQMNTASKEKIDADISRITIVNEVSSSKVSIEEGEKIKSFYVLLVSLKKKDFDERNIIKISKLIPQNLLMILECGSEAKLAVYHTKLMQTEWQQKDELSIELKGLNLDKIWENIIVRIGDLSIEQGNSLEEQIAIDEKKNQLSKQIEHLEKQARKENQPRKKFELAAQAKKLKTELDNIAVVESNAVEEKENIEQIPKMEKPQTMKALSIMPEYAHEILMGEKTVEYRTWKTDYRGDLLICASSRKCKGTVSRHAVCVANLADIHVEGHWDGRTEYGWDLENIRLIKPFPVKGKLHIYEVDASQVEVLASIHTKEADEVWEKYYEPLVD